MTPRPLAVLPLALIVLAVAGCGSNGRSSSNTSSTSSSSSAGGITGAGPLSAEAKAAATGDIPDTQIFLLFHNIRGGYAIKYPEGWTQKGTGPDVTFSDKNNIAHILVQPGPAPSTASVSAELNRAKASNRTLTFRAARAIRLAQGAAIMATYTTVSAPNAVTGKRVVLVVDRYEFARRGRWVTVDLGTPRGVDNVDAYRLMINSFTWR